MRKTSAHLRAEAEAEVTTLPVDTAIARHGGDGVVFVDLREAGELQQDGRIPGAIEVPRGTLEFLIDQESPRGLPVFGEDKQFIFFCAGGGRSALATKTAQDMGLARVAQIEGGFEAWKAAGGPVA
ncbi:rhodanese-like domain-containing protein [Amycolatopsis pigmentata]|uniref:Rhodanese-like domain-containing protein n=1 Tax=Amycolatopsis pigmentata TaxID=450801 RepID=A0ABW5FNQ6_9PSEU